MNPCICPAGALEIKLDGVKNLFNYTVQFTLNRPGVLLNLPAPEASAFVFNIEFETAHYLWCESPQEFAFPGVKVAGWGFAVNGDFVSSFIPKYSMIRLL